jgi:hypothetical protein
MGLSPVARRAQAAEVQGGARLETLANGVAGAQGTGLVGQRAVEKTSPAIKVHQQSAGAESVVPARPACGLGLGGVGPLTYRGAVAVAEDFDPESSTTAAERGAQRERSRRDSDAALARRI